MHEVARRSASPRSGRVPGARGGCIRREAGVEIAVSRPGGVLPLIRGGRSAEGWTLAAAEPSILRHGWDG